MIGYMMFRGGVRAARGTARAVRKANSKPRAQTKSFNEIGSTKNGRTAMVIFATLFVGAVILIGWYFTYMNARY